MKTYNLFVSHGWDYTEHYKRVIFWLNKAKISGKLNYKNYSDPKDDPIIEPNKRIKIEKMEKLLSAQIRASSIIIVISGMYVSYSNWIDFEIDTAVKMGKYIIGLKPWGQERIPTKVSENANILVCWNYESFIDSILNPPADLPLS